MADDDILYQGAAEQSRQIVAGRLDRSGLLRLQREAIARRNPDLNAYVQVFDPPLAADATGASPLAGSTFAVKDNIDVAGVPTHCGLKALAAEPAAQDASVVARLRAAGLACLGKLNMHPMALGATNHNRDFGDCFNPLRPGLTPGGSSGGSGSAVAAGLCGIALGTDTMGSVRIPAAYCGVVGFKPTHGGVPSDGLVALAHSLDHIGILARNVEDVVHALRIVAQRWIADTRADVPAAPRFAVPADIGALGAEPEVAAAFTAGLECLRAAGSVLVPVDLSGGPSFAEVRRAGLLLSEADLRNTLDAALRERRAEIPADLVAMMDFIDGKSAAALARALAVTVRCSDWLVGIVALHDALLLPTAPQRAFAMDVPVPHNQADYTAPANMAGVPAISLPLPARPGELPAGLQMVGRRGEDFALLGLAAWAETALRA